MAISTNKYSYIYLQIFNQFLNFKLNKFLFFLIKKKYYKLFLKQEFILPKSNSKLQKFEKNVLRTTKFLKAKNRFYYNFLNLIPSLENFIIAQQLVNQIAAELARTKKH